VCKAESSIKELVGFFFKAHLKKENIFAAKIFLAISNIVYKSIKKRRNKSCTMSVIGRE
jgi:hypothetical protein